MKPTTCIGKIPLGYDDFGSFALTDKGRDELDHQISIRLPEEVSWCGDELIADFDYEWPEDHPDVDEIISEARTWMCENASDDCWE